VGADCAIEAILVIGRQMSSSKVSFIQLRRFLPVVPHKAGLHIRHTILHESSLRTTEHQAHASKFELNIVGAWLELAEQEEWVEGRTVVVRCRRTVQGFH
jgi:hypothetical protein